jgi:hypothetical protein
MTINPPRIARLIKNIAGQVELDLSGISVLTEAATGSFAVTAPAAAFAGAKPVFALACDSPYGSAGEAVSETEAVATELGVESSIEFIDTIKERHISTSSIVTNTGFVRPIDSEMISQMREDTVIPLMFEPWEFREQDLDLEACWRAGIPVIGTNESCDYLNTQEYAGPLVAKLALENRLEVLDSTFLVIGEGDMPSHASNYLDSMGAEAIRFLPKLSNARLQDLASSIDKLEDGSNLIESVDALVVFEHNSNLKIIGSGGVFTQEELANRNDSLVVIHVCGNVDNPMPHLLNWVPERPKPPGWMSYTMGYVGPKPIVDLHTVSLKAAEITLEALRRTGRMATAIDHAVQMGVGADFSGEVKERFGFKDTAQ